MVIKSIIGATCTCLLISVTPATASVINLSAFSGTEYLDNFEEFVGGSGVVDSATIYGAYNSDHDLAFNPMIISVPRIPTNFGNYGFEIVNCCGFLFDNYAGASLNYAVRVNNDDDVITIDLPYILNLSPGDYGVNRVGGLLSSGGDPSSQWLVTTYDSLFNVIESATFSQPAIEDAVFFGFESETDIARITIDKTAGLVGNYIFLDDIRFESVETVPVPAAVWLFGSGLLGLVGVARCKVRI